MTSPGHDRPQMDAPRSRQSLLLRTLIACLPLLLGAAWGTSQAELKVAHRQRSLQPGEVVVFTVESPRPLSRLQASAFERTFPCHADDGRSWTCLVGIDLDARPGRCPVSLSGTDTAGKPASAQAILAVASRSFPTRRLTVDEKFVSPPKEALARIRRESEKVRGIFESVSDEQWWRGPFARPVPGEVISAFGKRSVYNGQPRSPHAGVDFRGATGTPVRAPNAGRIVLAENLYYSGNTVILDHGLGLYSYFGHLSAMSARVGDRVAAGDVIGKVGATGLVTGPHLHWTVRLAGTRVDPMSLLWLWGPKTRPD